jgi:hypothetical protein
LDQERHSTPFRLLRCIIFSGRMSELDHERRIGANAPAAGRARNCHQYRFPCIPDGYRLGAKSLEGEMQGREFIAAAAWPAVARSQARLRVVGMLIPRVRFGVFRQELARLGWSVDRIRAEAAAAVIIFSLSV